MVVTRSAKAKPKNSISNSTKLTKLLLMTRKKKSNVGVEGAKKKKKKKKRGKNAIEDSITRAQNPSHSSNKKKNHETAISSKKRKQPVNDEVDEDLPVYDREYLLPVDMWLNGKPIVKFEASAMENIKGKLSPSQLQMFKRTCFGAYLELNEMCLQLQLIHCMLLREVFVKEAKKNQTWFKVGEKFVRFSDEEFCLVTGLKVIGDDDWSDFNTTECRLKEEYFSNFKRVTSKEVEDVFKHLPVNVNDEDAVKIAIVHLVTSFLYRESYEKLVEKAVFNIVDADLGESFPWGKYVFKKTLKGLKGALHDRKPTIDPKSKVASYSYRLNGFPLAFQIWAYESIPDLDGHVCKRVNTLYPRILNWKSEKRMMSSQFENAVFDGPIVEVNIIEPTDEEKQQQYAFGLFTKYPVDVPPCPPSSSHHAILSCEGKEKEGSAPSKEILEHLLDIKLKQEQIFAQQIDLKTDFLCQMDSLREDFRGMLSKFIDDLDSKNDGRNKNVGDMKIVSDEIPMNVGDSKNMSDEIPIKEDKLLNENDGCDVVGLKVLTKDENKESESISDDMPSFKLLEDSQPESRDENKYEDSRITDSYLTPTKVVEDVREGNEPINVEDNSPLTQSRSKFIARDSTSAPAKVVKGSYAFKDEILSVPDDDAVAKFLAWYKEGFKDKNLVFKFGRPGLEIHPSHDFGILTVTKKIWWYYLYSKDGQLEDTHLDVCLFYLRKMIRFSNKTEKSWTTTDCNFQSKIVGIFDRFLVDFAVISDQSSLLEYVIGKSMRCNTSWIEVDHVLLPIMAKSKNHWMLVHFDMKRRCLDIYNSYAKVFDDEKVIASVRPFAHIIPFLLANSGYWDGKPNDYLDPSVRGCDILDPLLMNIVHNIPQQNSGSVDCGVFVIGYAQFLVHDKMNEMDGCFDSSKFRAALATQLFSYAKWKEEEQCMTDDE